MIISFSKREFKFREFDEDKWKYIVKEHITDGQGVKIAHLFDINYDEFPCLIAFKDIRSPEHVQVTLKGMEAEEIALRMRVLFSTIREAVAYDEDPLIALERRRSHEKYHNAGNTIVSQVRSLAGKTFESAMKAWIDAAIK